MDRKDFKTLIRAISPNERSIIIAKHLKHKIIFSKGSCYFIQKNVTYKCVKKYKDELLPIVTALLIDSFRKLSDDDRKDIEDLPKYKDIFENAHVTLYLPQLKSDLTDDKVSFDIYLNQTHFNNGYFDISTNEFKQRVMGTHFITNCITYDYLPPKKESIDFVLNKISKIYPDKDSMSAILTILGSALTGIAIRDSYILFFIGDGSAGKSTIMDLTKYTVECYLKQLKPDMFVEGKNTDKIINTYDKNPYIRVTWLNEPRDKKFDSTVFKSWADGECNAEKLYEEGSHDFKHYSLTFLTANNMPNIQVDGGTRRRIRACPHNSKFVDNKNMVNEENHVYLKDQDFKSRFEQSTDLKNAFFYLLATRAHNWLKTRKIDLPESFKELTETIIDSNDHIKDFIDGNLERTNNEDDRIGKHQMLELYSQMYPNKHLQQLQLQMLLKERGIKYHRQLRSNGVQGCFYGVKISTKYDKDQDDNDDEIEETIKVDRSVKPTLDEEIEHYTKLLATLKMKRLDELENKMKQKNQPKIEKPKKGFDKYFIKTEVKEKPEVIKQKEIKKVEKNITNEENEDNEDIEEVNNIGEFMDMLASK